MTDGSGSSTSYARLGALVAALFLVAYFVVAATIGFHGPPATWAEYGEPPRGAPIQQPICFWTDLGFVLAGLLALRRLDVAARSSTPPANPMSGPSAYSLAFGLIVVWMGPGSMLEHGTLTTTWGWFDAASIHWFALFVVGYLLLRASPQTPRSATIFWVGLATACALLGVWTWHAEPVRMVVSRASLVLVGVALLASLSLGRRVGLHFTRRAWGWFAGVALAFAAGFVFLATGAAGGPTAPWGHGAWHLCCAVAVDFMARLLAAEGRG
jgi:hypothetical protein